MYAKYKGELFKSSPSCFKDSIKLHTHYREKEKKFNFINANEILSKELPIPIPRTIGKMHYGGLVVKKSEVELLPSPEWDKFGIRCRVYYKENFFTPLYITKNKIKLEYFIGSGFAISAKYGFSYDWHDGAFTTWASRKDVIPINKMEDKKYVLYQYNVCILKERKDDQFLLLFAENLDYYDKPYFDKPEFIPFNTWKKTEEGFVGWVPKSEVFVYSEAKEPLIV